MADCPQVSCCPEPIWSVANPHPPPPTIPVVPPPVTPTTYWNTQQTADAFCPQGDTGGPFSSTVPAHTLSLSTTSPDGQAQVDAQAFQLARSQAQGQLGGCVHGGQGVTAQFSGLLWMLPTIKIAGTTIISGNQIFPPVGTPRSIAVQDNSQFSGPRALIGGYPYNWAYLARVTALGVNTLTVENDYHVNDNAPIPDGATVYCIMNGGSDCPYTMLMQRTAQWDKGTIHDLTMRLRGVVETCNYPTTGAGSVGSYIPPIPPSPLPSASLIQATDPAVVLPVTTPSSVGNNQYCLMVSDPPATYFLNAWRIPQGTNPADFAARVVDYTLTIKVNGQATIQLVALSVDFLEWPNTGLSAADDDPSHPIQVWQPFWGQWLQLDTLSTT